MVILIIMGMISLIFGLLFLFAPKTIIKLSELGNKLIYTDHGTIAHRYITGLILILASLVMFYCGLRL